jgi:hypothetical protein
VQHVDGDGEVCVVAQMDSDADKVILAPYTSMQEFAAFTASEMHKGDLREIDGVENLFGLDADMRDRFYALGRPCIAGGFLKGKVDRPRGNQALSELLFVPQVNLKRIGRSLKPLKHRRQHNAPVHHHDAIDSTGS